MAFYLGSINSCFICRSKIFARFRKPASFLYFNLDMNAIGLVGPSSHSLNHVLYLSHLQHKKNVQNPVSCFRKKKEVGEFWVWEEEKLSGWSDSSLNHSRAIKLINVFQRLLYISFLSHTLVYQEKRRLFSFVFLILLCTLCIHLGFSTKSKIN